MDTSFGGEGNPRFNTVAVVFNRVFAKTIPVDATLGAPDLKPPTRGPSVRPGSDEGKNHTRRNFVLDKTNDADSPACKQTGLIHAEPSRELSFPERQIIEREVHTVEMAN